MPRNTISVLLMLVLVCVSCGGESPEPAESVEATTATPPPETPDRAAPPVSRARIAPEVDGIEVAQIYTAHFYAGELDDLFEKFSDEMKTEIMPLEQLRENHAQFEKQFGRETEMVYEESKLDGEQRSFVRWARFEKYDGVIGVQWILHEDDTIAGFLVFPAEQTQ